MRHGFILLALALALAACGGGSAGPADPGQSTNPANTSADSANKQTAVNDDNVVGLLVDSGPDGKGVNRLYTSVTVCTPGSTSQCATMDHVLVDTGSVGLRLLTSALPSQLQLNVAKNSSDNVLLGCANFLDGSFAWGPLALADVKLGGLTASNTPVQLVGHSAYDAFQRLCSSWGDPIITAADLGANGILGVGLSKQDCGSACELQGRSSARNGKYFSCLNAACTNVAGTTLSADKQLQHVVARFPTDNNGFAIQMDSVPEGGAASASGKMIFGLGTRNNNKFASLQVLSTTGQGYLRGVLSSNSPLASGRFLNTFLDTGSNGIFFDSYLPNCAYPYDSGFYCPLAQVVLSLVLGNLGSPTVTADFKLSNAAILFQQRNAALPGLGGALNVPDYFDLGLPFFFGKTVAIGIDGLGATGLGSGTAIGPFYAL